MSDIMKMTMKLDLLGETFLHKCSNFVVSFPQWEVGLNINFFFHFLFLLTSFCSGCHNIFKKFSLFYYFVIFYHLSLVSNYFCLKLIENIFFSHVYVVELDLVGNNWDDPGLISYNSNRTGIHVFL